MTASRITRKDLASLSPAEFLKASSGSYRRLFSYMKPYKSRFVLGMVFGALFGVMQGALVFVVKNVADFVFPAEGAAATGPWVVVGVCALIPAIMVTRGIFSYLNAYCLLWVSFRILSDIRTDVFDKLMAQSMSFFSKAKAGELIQVVFGRTRMAQQALTQVAGDAVKQPVSVISALAVLFYFDWKFTLAALVLFPLCMLPVILVSKRVRKSGGDEEQAAGGLMVLMQEAFAGIRVVKSHAREDYERDRFHAANQRMIQNAMRWKKAIEMVGPMVESIASIGISAALFYAWFYQMEASTFIALNGGLILLYPSFKQMSRLYLLMQKCTVATSRVFEIMDTAPDIQDAPDAVPLENCRGHIQLENVTFSYKKPEAKKKAVREFTLDIPAGTSCALVGSSGAGKTTIISLLLRLWDVHEGRILIDGRDIRSLKQRSLRENIAIVSQDTFLFHDTIRANIRYARLDATDEEVEEAAKLAFAHEFILKQPDGYDTVAGDKGCLLSGGQQQRISIARALLKNAPILLLDEATSALDSESEQKIQAALDNLATGRTVIAIAHRLSTVLKADQIVVMADGRMKDAGPHAVLYEKSEIYRKLYDMQFHSHESAPMPAPAAAQEYIDPFQLTEP